MLSLQFGVFMLRILCCFRNNDSTLLKIALRFLTFTYGKCTITVESPTHSVSQLTINLHCCLMHIH